MWSSLIKIDACAETYKYTFRKQLIGAKVTCSSKVEYGKVDAGYLLVLLQDNVSTHNY